MGYAANESIISEIDTATVFLSTATRPRRSEWYIITPVPKKCWEWTPSSMQTGGTCTWKDRDKTDGYGQETRKSKLINTGHLGFKVVQQLINGSTKLIAPRADGLEIGVKEIDNR